MPPRDPPWQSSSSHVHPLAQYLSSLRTNLPKRPGGSRPPPFKSASYACAPTHTRSESYNNIYTLQEEKTDQEKGCDRRTSLASLRSKSSLGHPLVQAPEICPPSVRGRKVSPTATIQAAVQDVAAYQESGHRLLERHEVHMLREELARVDRKDEERRIHEAAQNEAAELVWQHRNPEAAEAEKTAPYQNPDIQPLKKHRGYAAAHIARINSMEISKADVEKREETAHSCPSEFSNDLAVKANNGAHVPQNAHRRRSSGGRRAASNGSSKGVFRNPEDQIYEEGEQSACLPVDTTVYCPPVPDVAALRVRPRNSLPRGSRPLPWLQKANTMSVLETLKTNRSEIHQNSPSQSRNAAYTVNQSIPPTEHGEKSTRPSSEGLEIRSDDIRAATSMRKSDRSPRLPTPSAVSDVASRPIVSFDPAWTPVTARAGDIETTQSIPARPPLSTPRMVASTPLVPTINLPDEPNPSVPAIVFSMDDAPPSTKEDSPSVPVVQIQGDTDEGSISVTAPTDTKTLTLEKDRPMPSRPLPVHTQSSPPKLPANKRLPWLTPSNRAGVPTATCANCSLAISGRSVTASGAADSSLKAILHPECFTCHHCSTPLEHVSFYPEPTNSRTDRLAASENSNEALTDDLALRFYCHLDFHEFFSPRCRSCKTPIEGEVIQACGHSYHVGHFFCAECGDPFHSDTPFVEKDGYAYCVNCHTRRTSARCKNCKKQVLDELTVEALGVKWHEACFVCFECGGGFGPDGLFFVREVLNELTEKERRRGLGRRVDERAVCEGCEGRRLKA